MLTLDSILSISVSVVIASVVIGDIHELCTNHHEYAFIKTEQELASHNNNPTITNKPIKLFDL